MPAKEITSWEDLQKNIRRIVVALEKDDNLKLAAASNPFYALEELGYKIQTELKFSFEDRLSYNIRFSSSDTNIKNCGKLSNLL